MKWTKCDSGTMIRQMPVTWLRASAVESERDHVISCGCYSHVMQCVRCIMQHAAALLANAHTNF